MRVRKQSACSQLLYEVTTRLPQRAYDVNSGEAFCAENQVMDVRCRTAGTHLPPAETGERVRCSVDEGLVCDSDFVCQDYELQVLCDCCE